MVIILQSSGKGLKWTLPVSSVWLSDAGQIVLTPYFLPLPISHLREWPSHLFSYSEQPHSTSFTFTQCHILSYICPFEHAVHFNVTYSFFPLPSCFIWSDPTHACINCLFFRRHFLTNSHQTNLCLCRAPISHHHGFKTFHPIWSDPTDWAPEGLIESDMFIAASPIPGT